MATLTPETGIQTPQDEDWRARPLQPNRAFETLFENIGQGIKNVGEYAYNSAKTDIFHQVQDTYDNAVEGQPGVASVINKAGQNDLQTMLGKNPVLAENYQDLNKTKMAADQGVMPKSAFWAQMVMKAKEMRARYPGWDEEISQMFNEVTGQHTLESRLDSAVWSEDNRGQKASEQEAERKRLIGTYYGTMYNLDPQTMGDYISGKLDSADPRVTNLMNIASGKEAKDKAVDADEKRLNMKAKLGEDVSQQRLSNFSKQANNELLATMHTAFTLGGGQTDIYKAIASISPGDPDAAQKGQLISQWASTKAAEFRDKMNQVQGQYMDGEGAVPQEKLSQVVEENLKSLKDIQEYATNGQYGLVSSVGRAFEAKLAGDSMAMAKEFPFIAKAAALHKLSPAYETSMAAMKDEKSTAALASFLTGQSVNSVVDDHAGDEANHQTSPEKTSQQLSQAMIAAAKLANEGHMNTEQAAAWTKSFTDGNDSKFYARLDPAGKRNYFSLMTQPGVQDTILNKGDDASKQAYVQWVQRMFSSHPDVITVGSRINQSNAGGPVTFTYNPLMHGFEATVAARPQVGLGSSLEPDQRQAQEDTAELNQVVLRGFNAALGSLGTAAEKMGQDPDKVITDELKATGINFKPLTDILDKKNAKDVEGAQQPAGDLSETPIKSDDNMTNSAIPNIPGLNADKWGAVMKGIGGIEHARYDEMGGAGKRFAGRYQMGADEITETAAQLGVKRPTQEEFLSNPALQDKFFAQYTKNHYDELMTNPTYAALPEDERLALLGYAHNQGVGGTNKYLATGQEGFDAFGTGGTLYMKAIQRQLILSGQQS